MNTLEEAAKVIENGWCTGELVVSDDGVDKFCAVGAVCAVEQGLTSEILAIKDLGERATAEDKFYTEADNSPAIKALALEIIERRTEQADEWLDVLNRWAEKGQWTEIVYDFNDSQKSVEPVLELFRYAAKRLED